MTEDEIKIRFARGEFYVTFATAGTDLLQVRVTDNNGNYFDSQTHRMQHPDALAAWLLNLAATIKMVSSGEMGWPRNETVKSAPQATVTKVEGEAADRFEVSSGTVIWMTD